MNNAKNKTDVPQPLDKIVIREYEEETNDLSEDAGGIDEIEAADKPHADKKVGRNQRSMLHVVYAILILLAVCIVGYIFSVIAYHMIVNHQKEKQSVSSGAVVRSDNQINDTTQLSRAAENELYYADYLLPESSDSYLVASDLAGFSKSQLAIAKNEIYARHGLIFTDEEFAAYFESCKWYEGTVTSVTDDMLNAYERANIALITKLENE